MDIPSVLVGAVIGAFVSVPITVFIEDPLRAFVRRVIAAIKGSSSGEHLQLENHAAREVRTIEEMEAELKLRKERVKRTRDLLDAIGSPPQGDE